MVPYWILFAVWTVGAIQTERQAERDPRLLFFVGAAILTALMIGLRYQVGGDWGNYQRMYENIFFLSFPAALEITDPGYATANWIAAQFDIGIPFVNMVCAGLFMGGVATLAWRQPNPALAVLVAVPYLIIVVAMGYTRQAAAIGVICYAIATASEKHILRLVLLIGIAAMFHKTAILILPIALVPIFRRSAVFGIIGFVMFAILFLVILRQSSNDLVTNYVQSNYDSQGAFIRVFMNVVAGLLFIFFRKSIQIDAFQKSFWICCALISIVSVFALFVSSASTGIDRISLYIIPLQMVTYARLPSVYTHGNRQAPTIILGLVSYSFLVEFVWLNYAQNAGSWVPYDFSLYGI